MNYRVLDISAYQGEVDFAKVKSDGIWGVMLKATEGERYLSPAFDKNYQKTTDSGLYVGAYHYLRASTPAEALKEAQFFLQKVAGKKLTLPLAVDIEAPEQQPIADLAPIAKAFCDEVERNKYYAMIYSTVNWFQTKLASSQLDVFDRWIAQVGVNQPTFNKPYGMWQYTWNAQINGITGRVDENISYKDYPTIIRNAGLNHLESEPEPPVSKVITVKQLKQMGYTSIQL